jgi:monolysocardiolipin acyltransferase
MAQERPYEPPLSHRVPSALTIGIVGFMCRAFLYAFSRTETEGLEPFLRILDERKDASRRERGLITVSNHLSVYVETV